MTLLELYARQSRCRGGKGRICTFVVGPTHDPEQSMALRAKWNARHKAIKEFLDKATSKAGSTFPSDAKLTCKMRFILNQENEELAVEIETPSGNSEFDEMCAKALEDLHPKSDIAWPTGTRYETEFLRHAFTYPNKWT